MEFEKGGVAADLYLAGYAARAVQNARWMLVESAQAYRRTPKVGPPLSKRQDGQSPEIKALSWRAQVRLNARYRRQQIHGSASHFGSWGPAPKPPRFFAFSRMHSFD